MPNQLGDCSHPVARTATLPQLPAARTGLIAAHADAPPARPAGVELTPNSTATAEGRAAGTAFRLACLLRPGTTPSQQHNGDRPGTRPRHACIELIDGADAVRRRALALARTAETELRIAIPATGPCGDWRARKSLARPTLNLRALCHDSARGTAITHIAGRDAQIRTAAELPPVLVISDQHTALIPIDAGRPCAAAICVRIPVIVSILADMFARTWTHATPYEYTASTSPAQITPAEQALLQLLAAGLTDEAAARRLDISVRTIRRQIASLMDRLGTTSRFQAGLQAAKRGWL